MRASLTVIIVLLVLAQGCASEEPTERVPPPTYPPASEPLPTVQAKTKWDLWTNGTRLRGADIHPCRIYDGEACVERTTRQDLVDLRNLGANLVNASYPGAFTIEAPYQADPVALGYLDDLIGWAEEVGVYVVIHFPTGPGRSEGAIHQDRNAIHDVWTDQAAHEAWIEMWGTVAERYRGRPAVVGYNLMVEPLANKLIDPDGELDPMEVQRQAKGTLMDWNAFAAEMTGAIRRVDADTPIIVASLNWADASWFPALRLTGDTRTVYSLHAYNPHVYTHQEARRISISYPDTVKDSGEQIVFDRGWLAENLRPAVAFADAHDVPIYVGEFGVMRWVPGGEAYYRDLTDLFEAYGWNYAVYVWRGDEVYFDGFNLEYGPEPEQHGPAPDNPLLGLFRERWSRNVVFMGID